MLIARSCLSHVYFHAHSHRVHLQHTDDRSTYEIIERQARWTTWTSTPSSLAMVLARVARRRKCSTTLRFAYLRNMWIRCCFEYINFWTHEFYNNNFAFIFSVAPRQCASSICVCECVREICECFLFETILHKRKEIEETRRTKEEKNSHVSFTRSRGDSVMAIKICATASSHPLRRRRRRRLCRYTYFNWTCWENMMCSIQKRTDRLRRARFTEIKPKHNLVDICDDRAPVAVLPNTKNHTMFTLQKCAASKLAVLFGNQSVQPESTRKHQI